jgi:hypothetical protein
MSNYIKGIGDALTAVNEILPSFDAKIFKYIIQNNIGVIGTETNKFTISTIDRGVIISAGMAYAYGYFGMCDSPTQFNFVMPTGSVQYVKVYAEMNLSVTPHKFSVKVSGQSATNNIPLLQDDISLNPSGVCQIPLFTLQLNTNGTITITDQRVILSKPEYAKEAENYKSGGGIASALALKAPLASPALTGTPTAPTAGQSVNNTQIATTAYVRTAVTDAKNIISGTVSMASGHSATTNFIKRQVNFVYGQLIGVTEVVATDESRTITVGNVGTNFKPKAEVQVGVAVAEQTSGANVALPIIGQGTASGIINTNGNIVITLGAAKMTGNHMIKVVSIFFGYEIT